MKKIHISSKKDFKTETFENLIVLLETTEDTHLEFSAGFFKDCTIEITSSLDSQKYVFNKTSFLRCRIIGKPGQYGNVASLNLNQCNVEECVLTGTLNELSIGYGKFLNNSEHADCNSFQIYDCNIFNSEFGGVCNILNLKSTRFEGSTFQIEFGRLVRRIAAANSVRIAIEEIIIFRERPRGKSIWRKIINVNGGTQNVVFSKYTVDPYYFITTSRSRELINISDTNLIDSWSTLRKEYSGVRLWLVFLLTIIYFAPLVTKALMLLFVQKLTSPMEASELFKVKEPLYQVLLFNGKEGLSAAINAILTLVLVLYNIIRYTITMKIAQLVEEEKFKIDSGFVISTPHPDKLLYLSKTHRFLKVFFYLSAIYASIRLYELLNIVVPVLN